MMPDGSRTTPTLELRARGRLLGHLEITGDDDEPETSPALRGRHAKGAERGNLAGFCLVMIDLDRFKEVNDLGGHSAGDRLLRATAAALTAVCRAGDSALRIGGDEFALILRDASRAQGAVVGARAGAAIALRVLPWTFPSRWPLASACRRRGSEPSARARGCTISASSECGPTCCRSPGASPLPQEHSAIGAALIAQIPLPADVAPLVRAVHERWDGSGYPDGLRGRAIPTESRIVAVCDAWDAMTSARPFRPALANREALAELVRCAGSQFDPEVVASSVPGRDIDPPRQAA